MVQDRSMIEGVGGGNPIKTKPDDSVLITEHDQSKISMSASRQIQGAQLKRSELEDDAPEDESSDDQEDKDRGVTFGKK